MSNASSGEGGAGTAASSGVNRGRPLKQRKRLSQTPTPIDDLVEAEAALVGDDHGEGNEEDDEAEGGGGGEPSNGGVSGGSGRVFGKGGGSGNLFDVLVEDEVSVLSQDLFDINIGSDTVSVDKVDALRAHSFFSLAAKETLEAKIKDYDIEHVAELPKGQVAVS